MSDVEKKVREGVFSSGELVLVHVSDLSIDELEDQLVLLETMRAKHAGCPAEVLLEQKATSVRNELQKRRGN